MRVDKAQCTHTTTNCIAIHYGDFFFFFFLRVGNKEEDLTDNYKQCNSTHSRNR